MRSSLRRYAPWALGQSHTERGVNSERNRNGCMCSGLVTMWCKSLRARRSSPAQWQTPVATAVRIERFRLTVIWCIPVCARPDNSYPDSLHNRRLFWDDRQPKTCKRMPKV
jgi:hypothetical protein